MVPPLKYVGLTVFFSDFFEFIEKFLPEQARRFLKLEEIIVEPGSDDSNSKELSVQTAETDAAMRT